MSTKPAISFALSIVTRASLMMSQQVLAENVKHLPATKHQAESLKDVQATDTTVSPPTAGGMPMTDHQGEALSEVQQPGARGLSLLLSLRPRFKKVLIAGSLLVVLLYLVYLFDWNRARDPLSAAAFERSNRKIVIQGDLRPTWGRPVTRLSAGGLMVGNVEGGSAPLMLELERLDVAVNFGSLLKGKLAAAEGEGHRAVAQGTLRRGVQV